MADRSPLRFAAVLGVVSALLVVSGVIRSASAASIRPDGLLQVDGKPMFPLGLIELGTYSYENWNERIQESRANLVWDIEIAYADTTPRCTEVLQAAVDGGYYLMVGSGDTWNWDLWETPELEVNQRLYELDQTQALKACMDTQPGRVIAFANRDEPVWQLARGTLGDVTAQHIHDTKYQLNALNSGAVVAMNFAPAHMSRDVEQWKDDIRSFASATDVMMFAAYPYPAGPGTCYDVNVLDYPQCRLDRLIFGQDIFMSELNLPGQPLWMIIQGFKNIPLKEARWEAAASVIHGATGIIWAGWNWVHWAGDGDTTWPVTKQVMNEMADLHDWLIGSDFPGVTSNQPDVEVRALESKDRVVVFAISRNGYSGPATIALPLVKQSRVTVLNEDRWLSPELGRITDTFDEYQAHIYRYSLVQTGGQLQHGGPVDAPATEVNVPGPFSLETFPNPTEGRTTVRFRLPNPATALFTVFDAAGRRVAVIGRGNYEAGAGEVSWNGRDLNGMPVAPGAYFVRGRTSAGEEATARILVRH